jgi:TonB family protein
MAQVKRKILQEWNRTLKRGMIDPIIVRFTILADGTVEDIELVQPSGSYLDAAAKSAVQTAGPFNKLPAHYETNRKVVEALFRPTP